MNVEIALKDRAYEVVLGEGVRREVFDFIRHSRPRAQALVVVTSSSFRTQSWFDFVDAERVQVIEVPEGESAKNFSALEDLCEELAQRKLSRDDVLIGVGGGAITDVVGFAAAVYLRGVPVVHVATSLVGQVDAAIGGKTAINLAAGKNLVGAFHQPLGVFCDFETLASLPERERLSGMGEIAKCWLLEGRDVRSLEATSLAQLIEMSVRLKAAIVGEDELESGRRALLNYGHTLAHAIEALALARDADELRHGEAVAIGLAYAARLAHVLGRVDADVVVRHDEVLDTLGLHRNVPRDLDTMDIVRTMGHDKKAHHDLTFVLAGPQGFEVVAGIDPETVVRVLESFRGEA
ncbi:MAG: 3-dehydroquinate synthase [Acidobacteria bacterium]|nr:3-dehydroquinate synthase [Acidobacteriota bacterium]